MESMRPGPPPHISQQRQYGAPMPLPSSNGAYQAPYGPPSGEYISRPYPMYPGQAGPSTYRPPPPPPTQPPAAPEMSGSQAETRPPKKRKTQEADAVPTGNAQAGPSRLGPSSAEYSPLMDTASMPRTAVPAGYVMPSVAGQSGVNAVRPPAPAPAVPPASDGQPVKRPRGRPRKSDIPPEPRPPVEKRPRGRPRKNLLPDLPGQAASSAYSGAGQAAGPSSASSRIPLPTPILTASHIPTHLSSPSASSSPRAPLPPPTTLKDYVNRLNAHIESTKSHSTGDTDAYLPTGEWSAADKASFYPILARHSSLRPDLIAHDTDKSEEQVQQYLGNVSAQVPASAGLRLGGRLGKDEWVRGIAPAARQITEAELREEEAAAEELLRVEENGPKAKQKRGKKKQDEAGWGAHLNGAKLSTLSALVNATVPADPLAGNKAAKVLRDEQALAALLEVPIYERTQSQQKEIRRLKDKKTMRMKYRHAKLLAEGMTAEEIAAQGGPDAIYLARSGPPTETLAVGSEAVDPLKGNKHAKIMRDEARLTALQAIKTPNRDDIAEIRRLTNKKRARQRIRKRKLMEEGMTEEQLATIDIDELFAQRAGISWGEDEAEEDNAVVPALAEWVSERGSDLWNYEKMARGLGDVQISFDILDQLKTYLLAFLVPLVFKTINIAEREGAPPHADHIRLSLKEAEATPSVPSLEEEEGEEWEVQTTTTDEEEEELDDLLDEVDEIYDRVREEIGGEWDDPFCVEKIRHAGGDEARAKRKAYLRLLNRYRRKQAKRSMRREQGRGGRSIGDASESLIGGTDEESLIGTTDEEEEEEGEDELTNMDNDDDEEKGDEDSVVNSPDGKSDDEDEDEDEDGTTDEEE